MTGKITEGIEHAWQRMRAAVAHIGPPAVRLLRSFGAWIAAAIGLVFQVVLALILLFEEWGWRPLADALAWLARFKIWARAERAIASLPPYGALAVLALPTSVLFPLKLLAVYLVAQGKLVAAGLLFVGAKIASTALIARLFMLTRPALMQLGWFASAYNWIMPWKEEVFARIRASWAWRYGRMVKNRVRLEAKQAWTRLKPKVVLVVDRVRLAVRHAFGRA
ncbi:hypothetical protein [Hyphomicrobium sp.]|uniref:hypothetical protein n=1 Tax=Hyphomicrobium sp. TaxID=82 RepID=UPI003F70A8E5